MEYLKKQYTILLQKKLRIEGLWLTFLKFKSWKQSMLFLGALCKTRKVRKKGKKKISGEHHSFLFVFWLLTRWATVREYRGWSQSVKLWGVVQSNQISFEKAHSLMIKQVDSTKYLGITFDSNLTWKSHINELCLKLSKTVGILSKVRHFVNKHILVMLYYSLIYPFLTYGVHVWGLTFPSFLTQLFIIQKKAIRIISFSEPKSHSEPLFKSLSLLKLNDVIELQILSFVYQRSHRLLPHCFSEYFKFTSSVHSYSTRQSSKRNI